MSRTFRRRASDSMRALAAGRWQSAIDYSLPVDIWSGRFVRLLLTWVVVTRATPQHNVYIIVDVVSLWGPYVFGACHTPLGVSLIIRRFTIIDSFTTITPGIWWQLYVSSSRYVLISMRSGTRVVLLLQNIDLPSSCNHIFELNNLLDVISAEKLFISGILLLSRPYKVVFLKYVC